MQIIEILEYLGLAAFSASGAYVAIRYKLDLFGIYILATVTAVGGGVLRDIVTDVGIPVFFTDYTMLPFILVPATIVILIKGNFKYQTFFVAMDSVGLAAFVVSSGLKAIKNEYNLMLFIFVTVITGVGGGIIRDILVRKKPVVFRRDIYATAGLLGAIILWALYPLTGQKLAAYISLVFIVGTRMLCYMKNYNLPIIRQCTIKQ